MLQMLRRLFVSKLLCIGVDISLSHNDSLDVDVDVDSLRVIGSQPLRIDESARRYSVTPTFMFCCVLLCFMLMAACRKAGVKAR